MLDRHAKSETLKPKLQTLSPIHSPDLNPDPKALNPKSQTLKSNNSSNKKSVIAVIVVMIGIFQVFLLIFVIIALKPPNSRAQQTEAMTWPSSVARQRMVPGC